MAKRSWRRVVRRFRPGIPSVRTAALLLAAGAGVAQEPPVAKIVFEHDVVDLGTVLSGTVSTVGVGFRNAGKDDLLIERFQANCGCLKPRVIAGVRNVTSVQLRRDGKPIVLRPGEKARLEVEFNGKGRRGKVQKKVLFFGLGSKTVMAEIGVKAECDPGYALEPVAFDFGDSIPQGRVVTRSVVVVPSSRWKGKVTGTKYAIDGVTATWREEKITAEDGTTRTQTRIDLTLTGGVKVGHLLWPLDVQTDSPEIPSIRIPVRAEVTPVVQSCGPDGRFMRLVEFGRIGGAEPVTREVAIVNHDPSVPYHVQKVSVQSRQESHVATELVPRADDSRQTLRLTVLPSIKAGNFNGSVLLESDHPSVPKLQVWFRGSVEPK